MNQQISNFPFLSLAECSKGCIETHSPFTIFISDSNIEDQEWNLEQIKCKTQSIILNMNSFFCQNKLIILQQLMSEYSIIVLKIEEARNSLNRMSWISLLDLKSVKHLIYISNSKNNEIIDFLNLIYKRVIEQNLLSCYIEIQNCLTSKQSQQINQIMSLSKLIEFHVNLQSQLSLNFQPIIEAFMNPLRSGCLQKFEILLTNNNFNHEFFSTLGNAISENKDSLRQITIHLQETMKSIPFFHPINHLGESLSTLSCLEELNISLGGGRKSEKSNINLTGLFQGIQDHHLSLSLNFYSLSVTSCLQNSLINLNQFGYQGQFTQSFALQVGIALSKAQNLTQLTLTSRSNQLGIILKYALRFSKSLLSLDLTFKGNEEPSNEFSHLLSLGIRLNTSLKQLTIKYIELNNQTSRQISILSEGISHHKSLRQLDIRIQSQNLELKDLYEFFENISLCNSLISIKILFFFSFGWDNILVDKLYLPLTLLIGLQAINLELSNKELRKKKFVKPYQLLKGLIKYTTASSIQLRYNYENFKQETYNYSLEIRQSLTYLTSFYKLIAPALQYLPNRHIIDLYY